MQMAQVKQVSKYQIYTSDMIGKGEQGVVLKCQNTQTNEQCCVKVINTDSMMQFQDRENEILKTIKQYPCCNVLNVYDIVCQDTHYFVFMEYCNYDLDHLIQTRQNYWFSNEEVYNILGQIVNGYQHLRKYNIVHRDLKPQNLLIKQLNNKKLLVKISDFGVGIKQTQSSIAITFAGTPMYQAPEITSNSGLQYTDQCDIYSLGLILFKLCYRGQAYAEIKTLAQLIQFQQTLISQPFKCPQSSYDIDPGLIQLIEQMIVHDPNRRITWEKLQKMQKLKPQFILLNDKYYVDFQQSLGSGMQGQTYLTFSLQSNEQFCTKAINHTQYEAQREIQIYRKIKDQRNVNIIQLFDLIEEGQLTYLIMEKCDENIEQYCQNKQQLSDNEIIDILSQIVNGYCYLKDLEIIHRDLKPQNILIKYVNQKPIIKIIDFGVGKIVSNQNIASTIAGTPIYSAPEVLEGGQYDFQCDIFSLGAMLFQILYGKQYVNPRNFQELQAQQNRLKQAPFKCPSTPEKNKDLKDLIEQMIRFYPKDRITWEQLKWHSLLQKNQKIKIISTNQMQQVQQAPPQSNQVVNSSFQQRQINDKIRIIPIASNNKDQQIVQNVSNFQSTPQDDQNQGKNARPPIASIGIKKSQDIDNQKQNDQPINQSRNNNKFDLKLALLNCFQSLSQIQNQQMDIAQYFYCLQFFFVKVSIQLEQESQSDIIKYLQYFICEVEIQCLKDLIILQTDRQIVVNEDTYQLPPEYLRSFLVESEVNKIIEGIQGQQNRLRLKCNNQDQIARNFKVLQNYLKKVKKRLTVYEYLSIYQEFYKSQQKNILPNQNYSDKTRFYLEKMYQIKAEIPIENFQSHTASQIMCKIQTIDMISKYLEEKKQQSGQ